MEDRAKFDSLSEEEQLNSELRKSRKQKMSRTNKFCKEYKKK